MRSVFTALMHVAGLASVFTALWSFLMFLFVVSDALVLWNASGYRQTVFTVAWVVFDPEGSWAEGRVDGRHEILSLDGQLPRDPAGWDDLEAMIKPGHRFDVLYHPTITRTAFQGRRLHLLPRRGEFPASARRSLLRSVLIGYGPVAIALGACLGFAFAAGRSPGAWLAMTLFFLGGQVLFTFLIVGVESTQSAPSVPGP